MGQAVVLVLALGCTGTADFIHGILLGLKGTLQGCHLILHVLRQDGRSSAGNAVGPEGNVMGPPALVVVPNDVARLDRQCCWIELVGRSLEHHVDIVALSGPGWSI